MKLRLANKGLKVHEAEGSIAGVCRFATVVSSGHLAITGMTSRALVIFRGIILLPKAGSS